MLKRGNVGDEQGVQKPLCLCGCVAAVRLRRLKLGERGGLPPRADGRALGWVYGLGQAGWAAGCFPGCHLEEIWGNCGPLCRIWFLGRPRDAGLGWILWKLFFSLPSECFQSGRDAMCSYSNAWISTAPRSLSLQDPSFINLNWQIHPSETCFFPITAASVCLISQVLVLPNRSSQDL